MCENPDHGSGSNEAWLGTSLSDMYSGHGPWSFHTPAVIPSNYHHVLYDLPLPTSPHTAPKPVHNLQPKHWDDEHVRMPYSPHSLFPVKENDVEVMKPRWEVIRKALSEPIRSSRDLQRAINCYNNRLPEFSALHNLFENVFDEAESLHFFDYVMPGIVKLALQLPDLIPGSFPLLKRYHCRSISLSQMQAACLLANSFLCTFIWRRDTLLPTCNFIRLFASHDRVARQSCVAEKLKCICHYFRRILSQNPVGCLTFERKFIPKRNMPRWDKLDNNLGNTKVHITSDGTIEDALGLLQVDFANKNVGGGVLGYGCVQEEIRFVLCPELIISRIFIEQLSDNEAVTIIGSERFSKYTGYGDSFKWDGNVQDETPFDPYRRRRTAVVVIDATRFNRSADQFHPSAMLRELNKAYAGFNSRTTHNLAPIATGNWGCGAFNGDLNLKSIIQLMACSAAGRNLVYYSFGNVELKCEFHKLHLFLAKNKITICQLWWFLCRFCTAPHPVRNKLYPYVQQCHFDDVNQPKIKSFLTSISKADPDVVVKERCAINAPGTSSSSSSLLTTTSSKYINLNVDDDDFYLTDDDDDVMDVVETDQDEINRIEEQSKPVKEKKEEIQILENNNSHMIKLIDIIDGDVKSKENIQLKRSFMEENNKLLKNVDFVTTTSAVLDKSTNDVNTITSECNNSDHVITMDIEDRIDVAADNEDNGRKKSKITDYFTKLSK